MREIKFRAWIKPDSEGNYGEMIFQGGTSDFEMISNGDGFGVLFDMERWLDREDFELMQYTGLTDKNGKEIYEGDVVLVKDIENGEKFQYETVFKHGAFCAQRANDFDVIFYAMDSAFYEAEIIGNIYESPELLKQP